MTLQNRCQRYKAGDPYGKCEPDVIQQDGFVIML